MNDRILDVFIDEALGGAQPPDLAERVVTALAKRRLNMESERPASSKPASGDLSPRPVPLAASLSASMPVPIVPTSRQTTPAAQADFSRRVGLGALALAASLLLLIGGNWLWNREATNPSVVAERTAQPKTIAQKLGGENALAKQAARGSIEPIAQHSQELAGSSQPGNPEMPIEPAAAGAPWIAKSPPGSQRVGAGAAAAGSMGAAMNNTKPAVVGSAESAQPPSGARLDSSELDATSAGNSVADAAFDSAISSVLSASASTDQQVVAAINAALKNRWKESGVRSSPAATESEWCRRVYLDCIGRIPTVEELEAFLIDNRRDKRARLLDLLLDDDRFVESYARFWTTLWTNRLIGRKGGMQANSPIHREGLQQYLRRSFLTNKPYQRMAYELLSAQGANRPGENDYNGAVNFLLAHLQEKATPATAKTAQIFLGLQVQCTQCHNHPFNDWKQNRFWELNAFFRQTRDERTMSGNQLRSVRLVDRDFAGEGGDADEAEVYFELRNGVLQVAYPTFIDGAQIDRDGRVSAVNRRRELALAVVRSEELKLAIVNWMWSHFFGYGFTRPVDDMGPHNPPSHPELLSRLAAEFAGHGYDLKRLIRWIALSDAYALSSKYGAKLGNAADDPTLGNVSLFSHFYVRQMSAEQLYDSLLVATGAHLSQVNYAQQQLAKDRWLEQFAIAFGTDENDEATTFDGTITQTLVMMNGELTRQATNGESGGFLSQVSRRAERAAALNELYLAALARRPSRQEVQVANSLLTSHAGDATTALEDIWWALLNSNEFILNH